MPEPKTFATNDPSRIRSRQEADRLIADPSPALMAWMEREGVRLDGKPSNIWGNVEQQLRKMGLWSIGRDYLQEQVRELTRTGVCGLKATAKEIVYRVLMDRILASREVIEQTVHGSDNRELECLPTIMQWVINHPLLGGKVAKEDPVMRALGLHYERQNKAPNSAARTLLADCQEDEKRRYVLFDKANAFAMDWKKAVLLANKVDQRTKVDAPHEKSEAEDVEASAEQQALASLDEELEGIGE
jgi:hypothetical protein